MTWAAVSRAPGADIEVMEVDLVAVPAGYVRVGIAASGVCGTDRSVAEGHLPSVRPLVLGHQGAGVVLEVGAGVDGAAVGDHVVVAAMPQCGECSSCRRGQRHLCIVGAEVLLDGALRGASATMHAADGAEVWQMTAAGTFAEEVVVPALSVVPIPPSMPFDAASLLGCAVLTGAGAAWNAASVRADDVVVVIGAGAVGLCVVQGARLAGAGTIIVVDLVPSRLQLARRVGADHVVDAHGDVVAAVQALAQERGGADVVFEAAGVQATVDLALRLTGRGGQTVFVGAGGRDVRIDVRQFADLSSKARTLTGVLFGQADVRRDIARIAEAYEAGQFLLDELVSHRVPLRRAAEAVRLLGTPEALCVVINMTGDVSPGAEPTTGQSGSGRSAPVGRDAATRAT